MNLFNLGLTLDTFGKVLLGITVLMVHWHVLKEHKIDADVLRSMKREQILAVSAIFLIITGYILQLLFH
ncbi:MAG: hypothetical protein Q8Q48_04600 [Candidatus Staskawiczbacteria bacterium]|nr:hypothetical protein [Candidatus Staskawiczbacteria bacterium]